MKKTPKATCDIHDWSNVVEAYAALHVRYPRGELIYQAGSYAAGIYVVSAGLVCECLIHKLHQGQNAVCEILGAGDLIGCEIIMSTSGSTYLTTARAITETDLFFFERTAFQQLLEAEASLPSSVLFYLSHRLLDFRRWAGYLHAPLQYRVCQLLLMLVSKSGTTLQNEIAFLPQEVTPTVLAEILDVPKKKVLRALNALPEVRCDKNHIGLSPKALQLWETSFSEQT